MLTVTPTRLAALRGLVEEVRQGRRGWWTGLGLRILSWPYGLAVGVRNRLYDHGGQAVIRAPVPVLSIGNLTVGGTGKTPMVEFFCRRLCDRGLRVAILSRGYGAADGPNDEALVLEENLPHVPHLQGADRARLADIAVAELDSQVLVLDDGFQHRRLHRDLDVVLLDATDPFGGGRQLPAGLLREPLRSLRRAGMLVLTRCDHLPAEQRALVKAEAFRHAGGGCPWAEVRFTPAGLDQCGGPTRSVDEIRGRDVLAFCGIGNPRAFWRTVEGLGARLADRRAFPDHHPYSRHDVERLAEWARSSRAHALITTQKDLVKLRVAELAGIPLWAIRIEAHLEHGHDAIDHALASLMHR